MAKATDNKEVEVKLQVADLRSARRLLRERGFRVEHPRVFERNFVFDTADGSFRASGQLIRVRTAGKKTTLTYKGPPHAGKIHKSREEFETRVDDAAQFGFILGRLGYRRTFEYQKWRTEFVAGDQTGRVVTLDETPIGTYLEIEGPPRWIDQTAKALGFSRKDYITESYGALYLTWCRNRKLAPANMVFEK